MSDANQASGGNWKAVAFAIGIPLAILAAVGAWEYYATRSSPAEKAATAAEARLALVSKHGTLGDECAAAKEVEAAWLNAEDEDQYKRAQVSAELDCNLARLEGEELPANNEERTKIRQQVENIDAPEMNAPEMSAPSAASADNNETDTNPANATDL